MNLKPLTALAALTLTASLSACGVGPTVALPAPATTTSTIAPTTTTTLLTILPEVIEEDDPRWDCATMGNRICGPQPVPAVKEIVEAPIISNQSLKVSTQTVESPHADPIVTAAPITDHSAVDEVIEVIEEPVIEDEGDQWVSIDPPARPLPGSDITYSWTPEKPWNVPSVMDPQCGDYSISYQSIPGCMTEPNEGRGDGTPS